MGLPTPEAVKKLLQSSRSVRKKILSVARRLEALNEYNPEQALIVAADLVMHSLKVRPNSTKGAH